MLLSAEQLIHVKEAMLAKYAPPTDVGDFSGQLDSCVRAGQRLAVVEFFHELMNQIPTQEDFDSFYAGRDYEDERRDDGPQTPELVKEYGE